MPPLMDARQFELLLSFHPRISSEKVKAALEDVLVNGCSQSDAADRQGLHKGQLSLALKNIRKTENTVRALAPFYI